MKGGFVCAARTNFLRSEEACPPRGFQVWCFAFPSPSAPLRLDESIGRFRRALFEFRGGARCVCPARASCAAPYGFIQPKEAVGWRGRGHLLLVTFLGEARKVTCCRATPDEVDTIYFTSAACYPPRNARCTASLPSNSPAAPDKVIVPLSIT